MSSLLVSTFGFRVAAFFTFKLFNFDEGVVASFVFIAVVVDDDVDVTTDGWVTNTAPENGASRGLLLVSL